MQTRKLIAGLAFVALVFPAVSFAHDGEVHADVQTQVQSLMSQIHSLQLQLKALLASSTVPAKHPDDDKARPGQFAKAVCIELKRDLRVGAKGEDVHKLQEMLASDPESGFRAKATGFFGPLTATAVAKFQARMGIASSTDGRVGVLTRGFFQRACGQGLGSKDESMRSGASISGEISASSGLSFTIRQKDGELRVVNITSSTTIKLHDTATSSPHAGTSLDLTIGKSVHAEGEKNADGSITARHIKVGVRE